MSSASLVAQAHGVAAARELIHLGKFGEAHAYLVGLPTEVFESPDIALIHANLQWRQGNYKAAEEVSDLALADHHGMILQPNDSMIDVALLLQRALARCETRGTLIDAKSLCEQVEGNILSKQPKLDELSTQMVWVELLYHEIILLRFHYGEDWDKSVETNAAQRLCQILGLILSDAQRYHEAYELLCLCVQALPVDESVDVVSDFITIVRADWALGHCHAIHAKIAFKVATYAMMEEKIALAVLHFNACGNEIGLVDCELLRACTPTNDSEQHLDTFHHLQMKYKHLSYPFGMISCLRAQASHAISQRQFHIYFQAYKQLLALRDECSSQLGWCYDQRSMLSGAALEGSQYGAIHEGWLAILKKLEAEAFQVPVFTASCHPSFAISLLDIYAPAEATQWAQRAVTSHSSREHGAMGSDAVLALALAKERFQDIPDDKYRVAFDLIVDQLESWAEADGEHGMHERQIEKCLVLAKFQCKLVDRVGRDAAFKSALEWTDKAQKIAPLLTEEECELAYGDIAFRRAYIYGFFDDREPAFNFMLTASKHLVNAQSPRVPWVLHQAGLNRLLSFNIERLGGGLTIGRAVTLLNDARSNFYAELEILESRGVLSKLAVCHFVIARVWQAAYEIGQNDALDEALTHIEKAEQIRDALRYEFSVLSGPENLPRKHSLVGKGEDIISLGLELYYAKGDVEGLWSWVQKAKARSLLDVMGVGAMIPVSVTNEVSRFPDAVELLERERVLTAAIEQQSPDKRFELRRQLTEIRMTMRKQPKLRNLLTFRGVHAIDQNSMIKALQGQEDDIVFVDWTTFGERIVLVVARPASDLFKMWDVGLTREDVAVWRQNNLVLLKEDDGCLRELDPLTAHLAEFTNEKDLLILSPAGPLHGLPLHALLVENQVLVARNRFIYSASLSILHHCIERRPVPAQKDWCVAIFGNPTNDRKHGSDSAIHLGRLFHTEAKIGDHASLDTFRDLASSANLIHYHGHARYDVDEPLQSALFLAGKARLTAQDIFTLPLVASLVTLIACSSGAQQVNPGDEPTGLIPSFLCAGANAVVGTLWPVKDVHGKEFAEVFYAEFAKGGTIDLAEALRNAVLKVREKHPRVYHWASFTLHGSWILDGIPKLSSDT